MVSSAHIDKKKLISILRKRPTQGLEHTLTDSLDSSTDS